MGQGNQDLSKGAVAAARLLFREPSLSIRVSTLLNRACHRTTAQPLSPAQRFYKATELGALHLLWWLEAKRAGPCSS